MSVLELERGGTSKEGEWGRGEKDRRGMKGMKSRDKMEESGVI